MTKQTLLKDLRQHVENFIFVVEKEFKSLSVSDLNQKENVEKWSVLECLEHLNRYAAYYIPAIKKGLQQAKNNTADQPYKNGWFGKMSIDMMSPDNLKKQKAINKFNPVGSQLDSLVIDTFLTHQKELLALLELAKNKNIQQRKVPVEFFKVMKMKIGDALTFVITHQHRHILQAQKVKENLANIR